MLLSWVVFSFEGHPATSSSTEDNQMNVDVWMPLAITHIEYPPGDIFGKGLALMSLLPLVIISGFVTLILFRRDLHTISFFLGTVVNELVNLVLKHLIKEARPCRGGFVLNVEKVPFFVSKRGVLNFYFYFLFRLHHANNCSPLEHAWKFMAVTGGFGAAMAVSYSRIYLQYHTWLQVLCGSAIGVIVAAAWFGVTQFLLTPLFPVIMSWPISEFLMIRDTTLIPNIMWFEYTQHRTEARARQRKLV
ncbi:dolichyldiphosphatase 1-like [Limulus polyphemus]|uniref:Dolichyldiphosphatase n=1 Tax=Limulus polyphemus TaxID=6850 RepID=A0ABM1TSS5_LIMPO|nr:dolichyldiphosphatase 1-like [Limulus polyphemus]